MKRKAKIQLVEALSEYSELMKEASGCCKELYNKDFDPCKTEIIIHLFDGTKITLSNRHEECSQKQQYCGDSIINVCYLVPEAYGEVDYLDVEIRGDIFSRKRIPLECVAWVEMNQELNK